jgi:hypothetical protein
MNIIFLIVIALLVLKIGWNFFTPYVLGLRALRANDEKKSGISMAPAVEIVLLLAAWGGAFLVPEPLRWLSPRSVILWGMALVFTSYLHLVVAGALVGCLVSKYKKRPQRPQ